MVDYLGGFPWRQQKTEDTETNMAQRSSANPIRIVAARRIYSIVQYQKEKTEYSIVYIYTILLIV